MNIIKKLGSIVLLAAILIGSTGQASAAFFDNSSSWSYDALYQAIPTVTPQPTPNIDSDAVVPVTSPAQSPAPAKATVKTYTVSITAYSSSVDETDSTPFITAAGTYVRDGIVAANFLPMGTAIKIPALYGNKIFVVEDRMNSRYHDNVDIWFPSKAAALQFGRKTAKIEVVS